MRIVWVIIGIFLVASCSIGAKSLYSGSYFGVKLGYRTSVETNSDVFQIREDDAWDYGVYAGVNYVFTPEKDKKHTSYPKVVVGIEGEYNRGNARIRQSLDVLAKLTESYGVGVHAGILTTPYIHIYTRLGWIREEYDNALYENYVDGIKMGAGLEFSLTNNISTRAEVIYRRFDKNNFVLKRDDMAFVFGLTFHY